MDTGRLEGLDNEFGIVGTDEAPDLPVYKWNFNEVGDTILWGSSGKMVQVGDHFVDSVKRIECSLKLSDIAGFFGDLCVAAGDLQRVLEIVAHVAGELFEPILQLVGPLGLFFEVSYVHRQPDEPLRLAVVVKPRYLVDTGPVFCSGPEGSSLPRIGSWYSITCMSSA